MQLAGVTRVITLPLLPTESCCTFTCDMKVVSNTAHRRNSGGGEEEEATAGSATPSHLVFADHGGDPSQSPAGFPSADSRGRATPRTRAKRKIQQVTPKREGSLVIRPLPTEMLEVNAQVLFPPSVVSENSAREPSLTAAALKRRPHTLLRLFREMTVPGTDGLTMEQIFLQRQLHTLRGAASLCHHC